MELYRCATMLLENKKTTKMAYTIENLAKSSRDEPSSPVPLAFPNLPPIGIAPMAHLLDNYTPVKLQATTVPVMSTPKTNTKRKRNNSEVSCADSTNSSRSKSSEESLESLSPCVSDSEDGSDSYGRRKKARTAFTNDQICALEKRYHSQKYLPANERSVLAQKLKLSDQQVKTWFQNRRMKEKRQQRDDDHSRSFSLPTGGVDISQLIAMGMPCPPPHNMTGSSMLHFSGFLGAQLPPSQQVSPYGSRSSQQVSPYGSRSSHSSIIPSPYSSPYNASYDRLSPQSF